MFIDHKRKFAMVAVPKTGSTSLHHAVMRAVGTRWKFRATSPHLYHMAASDIRMIVGRGRWRAMHSVAVTRSPFDRAVSLFHDFSGRGAVKSSGFTAYAVEELPGLAERDVHFFPQVHFLTEETGKRIIVSRLHRFEDGLDAALADICARIGAEPKRLGHARRSERGAAPDYYADPAAIEAVRRVYAADFAALGYRDDAPGRP